MQKKCGHIKPVFNIYRSFKFKCCCLLLSHIVATGHVSLDKFYFTVTGFVLRTAVSALLKSPHKLMELSF